MPLWLNPPGTHSKTMGQKIRPESKVRGYRPRGYRV